MGEDIQNPSPPSPSKAAAASPEASFRQMPLESGRPQTPRGSSGSAMEPSSPNARPLWAATSSASTFQTASMYYQPLHGGPYGTPTLLPSGEVAEPGELEDFDAPPPELKLSHASAGSWVANFPSNGVEEEEMKTRPVAAATEAAMAEEASGKEKGTWAPYFVGWEDVTTCFWPYGGILFRHCVGAKAGRSACKYEGGAAKGDMKPQIELEGGKPTAPPAIAQLEATAVP